LYYCIQIINCYAFPIVVVIFIIITFFFFLIICIAFTYILAIMTPYTCPFIKSMLAMGNPWLPGFNTRLTLGMRDFSFTKDQLIIFRSTIDTHVWKTQATLAIVLIIDNIHSTSCGLFDKHARGKKELLGRQWKQGHSTLNRESAV
jgi:hypothetical protein